VTVLAGLGLWQGLAGDYRWLFFVGIAVLLLVLPAAVLRTPDAMPPGELLVVIVLPVADAALLGETVISPVAVYLAVAAVALVVAVDVHTFTAVRMNRLFAVALVVITTLAVGAVWNITLWVADLSLGTSYLVGGRTQDAANYEMMVDFLYAATAGALAGGLFTAYVERRSFGGTANTAPADRAAGHEPDPAPTFLRGRLNVPEKRAEQLSWALQAVLLGLLVYGLAVRDVPTVVNAGISLAVTRLPGILERNFRLPIEPELVLWLTLAAFLHTLGSAGLYDVLAQWDSLTHALSASLVAATGYTIVRTFDLHAEDVYISSRMMVVFILLFVLAVGVVWELVEFTLDMAAARFGFEAALAQHGINDTATDLLFNLAGAVLAATLGGTYLTGLSRQLAGRLSNRDA
jgi:hypothetical protein